MNYGPVLEMMGRPKKKQSAVYRRFVECGISDIDAAFIETKKRSGLCIGSDECHRRMAAHYQEMLESFDKKEDVSFRRESKAHSVEEVFRDSWHRLKSCCVKGKRKLTYFIRADPAARSG